MANEVQKLNRDLLLDALEQWIVAIFTNQLSDAVEDAVSKMKAREHLIETLDDLEKSDW